MKLSLRLEIDAPGESNGRKVLGLMNNLVPHAEQAIADGLLTPDEAQRAILEHIVARSRVVEDA